MSQHYFLVASLPSISFDTRDPMEPKEFLDRCETQLSTSELQQVRESTIDAPSGDPDPSGIPGRWKAFERGLRNALVRERAAEKSVDPALHIRLDDAGDDNTSDNGVVEIVRAAAAHETPLGAEDELNHARWSFLDELEVGYFFELERLIIYYLKLQILARRRLFKRQRGEERFTQIKETIISDYYESEREQST